MWWTIALLSTSITGVWLAARHWFGWAITVLSEGLWAAYAISRHDTPLLIMSGVWALVNGRNAIVTWKDQHK